MSVSVIYACYSTTDNESMSAETQIKQCREYCRFHDTPILAEFKDEPVSGKDAENREGFQEAIELACERKAIFVCNSLSRFARSTKDAIICADRLNKAKAELVILKEQISTTATSGRFVFSLMAALAELEREQIVKHTRGMMRHYQASGRRMSHLIPYGWHKDPANPKLIIKNAHEQAIIELAVALRKEGKSFRKISNILWQKGIYGRRYPVFANKTIIKRKKPHQVKTDRIIAWRIGRFHHDVLNSIIKRAGLE